MDPISLAVTILAVYGILTRTPGLIGEAVREVQFARRGEESPAAAARRERLEAAGIDPATGGAFRQYAGNVWRDHWLDKEAERAKRRAKRVAEVGGSDESARGWRERFRDRLDEEVERRANRWRTRPAENQRPPVAEDGDSTRPDFHPDPEAPKSEPAGSPADDTRTSRRPPAGSRPGSHDDDARYGPDDGFGDFDPDPDLFPDDEPSPTHKTTEDADRDPIRVAATVGAPSTAEPTAPARAIEGAPTMSAVATRPGEVTGVQSGANEARRLAAAVQNEAAQHVANLRRIRAQIAALGEQTIGTVQMANHATVVAMLAAAAEAAAAAENAARSCASEVGPQLANVARAFDRLNS